MKVDIAVQVVAGLLVLAIAALLTWLWKHRNKPVEAVAQAKQRSAVRAHQARVQSHSDLVKAVMDRAAVIKMDVPVSVTGSHPAVVTWHPSGRKQYLFPDLASYKYGVEADPSIWKSAFMGQPPPPISRWSVEMLTAWQQQHKNKLPPTP